MPARKYARGTTVPMWRTQQDLQSLLRAHGASEFLTGWSDGAQYLAFRLGTRKIRFMIHVPDPDAPAFTSTPTTHQKRPPAAAQSEYQREVDRLWRVMIALVKMKLVAIAEGASTIEEEFLSNIVLGDGASVGEVLIPKLDDIAGRGSLFSQVRARLMLASPDETE